VVLDPTGWTKRSDLWGGFAIVLVTALALSSHASAHLQLVSRSSDGTPANGHSTGGALSRDGSLVAFGSQAKNLPGGRGLTGEVYVRDVDRGETELVSTNNNGVPANETVLDTDISPNGRFVVFQGLASNLPGGDGRKTRVWIHDRESGRTSLVSKANDGEPAHGPSYGGSVSANGRFVAFSSYADNLPLGDGNNPFAYVRDLKDGKTRLVSKRNGDKPATGEYPGISSNGQRVVFESTDPDLPGGDGHTDHVYLRDLKRRHTVLVDRSRHGKVAEEDSHPSGMSGNGRFVAFESYADNLPGGDGIHSQVYLRNLKLAKTRLVSRNNAGDPQNHEAYSGRVSGSGRYVVFSAQASNLPGGSRHAEQVYVRDMRRNTTRLLSKAANGDPAHFSSYAAATSISLDGRWAAFFTDADNLGGDPRRYNVFRAGPIG
jgi:Tol biopolymer transport system component